MPLTDSRPIWDMPLNEILSQAAPSGTRASATDIPGVNLEWMVTDAYPSGAWFGTVGNPTQAQLNALPTAFLATGTTATINGQQVTWGGVEVGWGSRSQTERTIVLLGDSYENYCYAGINSPWTDFIQAGYFHWGNALLNQAYTALNNSGATAGHGGETSAQIAARVYSDAIAYQPDRILVGGGTNDDLTTTAKVDAAWNAISEAYAQILQSGIRLTIRTSPPRNSELSAQIAGMADFNNRKREFAERHNCVLLDLAAVITNPISGVMLAAGEYGAKANYYQADQTHMSPTACSFVGALFADAHSVFVSKPGQSANLGVGGTSGFDLIYSAERGIVPSGNIISNGKMIGTTGSNNSSAALPGAVATGWTQDAGGSVPATGGSGAVSKVQRAGPFVRGEWQQITINPGASGQIGMTSFFAQSVVDNGESPIDGSRGLIAGDVISAQIAFETDDTNWCGSDGLSPTNIELRLTCQQGSTYAVLGGARAFPGLAPNGIPLRISNGILRTPEIVIPSGTAHIFVYVYFSGVGTVRFGEVSVRKA